MTWKEVNNAAEYYIYRSEDGQRFEHVGTAKKNTYTDRGLDTGERYLYKVVSSNYIKVSDKEAKAKGVTKIDTPVISGDTRTGKVRITISKRTRSSLTNQRKRIRATPILLQRAGMRTGATKAMNSSRQVRSKRR